MSDAMKGEVRLRGQFVERVIHDLTRVGHPKVASIFELDNGMCVIPENDAFPVMLRDTLDSAMSYVEQIILAK